MKNTISRLLSTGSLLCRRFCTTGAATIETVAVTGAAPATESVNRSNVPDRRLFAQFSMLVATGGKASDVLNKYIREGRSIKKPKLMDCLRSLRKSKRYQVCLEILEWLDEHKFYFSPREYSLYLDIIYKTKGISQAEKYFDSLSTTSKNLYTYGALLNCYCMERLADKAFALFKAMEQLNYASTSPAFNSIMRLQLYEGTPERVPPLLLEMIEKGISPDTYTYNNVLQSYAAMNDLESVERIHKEIKLEQYDWTTFTNLATAYIKVGHANEAESVLGQLEEYLMHKKLSAELIAYRYLISLYAGIGNSSAVNRAWERFKSEFPSCSNLSYLCMLQALSKLDDIEALKTCFEEWESQCKTYDPRLTAVVIIAFLRHDMLEEAEKACESATSRSKSPFVKAHECFMYYFLKKGDIEKALRQLERLEEAVTVMEGTKWHPSLQILYEAFQCFEREKDVENAEKLCRLLKDSNYLDSKAYLLLLRVYVAAGKRQPEMRQRMEKDGIDISVEHENLLDKILEWLDEHKFYFSPREYSLYLDIIYKTKGISQAEKYFDSLSTTSKNLYTYGALLNCYCMERLADKAFALFKAMEQLNYASTSLAFNSIMRLQLYEGTPERVPPLLLEMKEKGISPDTYTYNNVLQSYAAMNDLESVERIHKEIKLEQYDWTTFTNLATAYIKVGHANEAESVLGQLEEYLMHKKLSAELIAYRYLISLYAGIGNSSAVNRAWERFKSEFPSCSNLSYLCMLQALSKLDDIEALKTCFEEWESQCKTYDPRLTAVVIIAFLRHDMLEEAEKACESATSRSKSPFVKAHECFMYYFLKKGDIEKALRQLERLEEAVTVTEGTKWHPSLQRLYEAFQCFEREKDVENAEKLCRLLKDSNYLDSKAYLLLLRVYVAAGKRQPEMRQRMEKDGIDISVEHENLLDKVCVQ